MLDPRLNTFLTLCKTRNFTKAAELLNITQPAVTKHIKSLEEHFKIPLFKRKGRLIELTPEGNILFEYARKVESQTLLAERKIKNSSGAEKRYTIGATLTIGEYVLPYILGRFKEFNPSTDVIMQVHNTDLITKKLLGGDIDLGMVEGPFDKSRFLYEKLKDDELVLAASPKSPLGRKAEVDLNDVLKSKLILREEGSGTRKVMEDKLTALGIDLKDVKPYMEIGSIGAIKSLVELNLGCTIISRTSIQKEVAAGALAQVPIKNTRIMREFDFIYLDEGPKEFIDAFIAFSRRNVG